MDRLLIKQLQSKAQNLAVAEVRPEVSVVVPIYNEVESLPHLIEAIATSLNSTGLSYELICVDDGSQDGSAELLKEQAIARPNLRLFYEKVPNATHACVWVARNHFHYLRDNLRTLSHLSQTRSGSKHWRPTLTDFGSRAAVDWHPVV
jgi:glycosyltransferase involved in cell wall biosynthesis